MIQKVRDTRRALLDAATEAVSKDGLEGTSLRAICARVGVQLPTLYHFFGDKTGLLDAVVNDSFGRYLAAKDAARSTGDPAVDVRAGWDVHVGFASANPGIYPLMFPGGNRALPAAALDSAARLRDGFALLAADGALRPGLTAEQAARTLSAALHGVAVTIARDPAHPGNTLLSVTVRDAVVDALLDRRPPTEGKRFHDDH
jgi:AcrR family transcriptional regulator